MSTSTLNPTDAAETVRGLVHRTYFSSPAFSAGVLRTDDGDFVRFRGKFCAVEGDALALVGRWTKDRRFGLQFDAEGLSYDLPETLNGLVQYLAAHPAFKGIGPRTAEKIVDFAGSLDALDRLIRETPGQLHERLKVPMATVQTLCEAWIAHAAENEVRTYLAGFGLTHHQATVLLDTFGESIVGILRQDPYRIVQYVAGYGFKRVDKIARQMGTPKEHPGRLEAALRYCLTEEVGSGHTWTAGCDLLEKANDCLLLDTLDGRDLVRVAADRLLERGDIVADGTAVSTPAMLEAEQLIHETLKAHAWTQKLVRPEACTESLLNPGQLDAYRTSLARGISVISGGAGTGKAQPLDAKILTPSGWRLMGDIKVGNKVIGANGRACRVLAVYPQGKRQVYRVTMTDGASTECCDEHLWLTRSQKDRDRARSEAVLPLHAIRPGLRGTDGKHKHWIPIVAPVEFAAQDLPLEPYALGLLLGDGCFRVPNGCGFSNAAPSVVEALQSLLPSSVGLRQSKSRPIDYRICGNDRDSGNILLEILRDLGLDGKGAAEKFVPDVYKFSRSAHRLALLQGLLDADGSAYGHTVEYSTTSPQLAHDVVFLAQSLGGTTSLAARQTYYAYLGQRKAGKPSYRIHLCLPGYIWPFRMPRKASSYIPHTKYLPRRAIWDVRPAGIKEVKCIAVDAPDHLYVTDDFIVTHNTYTVSAITRAWQQQHLNVALCAPTGKAAKRIEEVMRQHGLALEAKTIHRLLGYDGHTFHRESLSLPSADDDGYDVVTVDEVSMVDVPLLADLFRRINFARTRVVLVGDHNQLPPVGPGNVLRDIIRGRLAPTTVLTEVVRQAGILKANSTKVLSGVVAPTAAGDDGWVVIDAFKEALPIQTYLRDLVLKLIPERLGYDPVRDVQIVTPTHKGPLGTKALNEMMQHLLHGRVEGRFAIGDKVIQTSNDYTMGVMNGTIGEVAAIEDGAYHVDFNGEGRHKVDGERLSNLQLAYALTAHKAQGSEFPCVVVVCHKSHFFADRNWLYTAVTRAARTCILVGDRWGLKHAAAKNHTIKRRTLLSLWASRGETPPP